MKKNEKIEQEIRKTLDQFDHAEQLPPNPYFYTRVQARLEEKHRQQSVLPVFLRVAFLTVLFAINFVTGVWYLGGIDQTYQTDTRQELAGILAADLKLDTEEGSIFLFEQE